MLTGMIYGFIFIGVAMALGLQWATEYDYEEEE